MSRQSQEQMQIRKVDVKLDTRAMFKPQTANDDDRTIEIVWSTGSRVRRESWFDGTYYEELSLEGSAVRLERLNLGAPILDTHESYRLSDQFGVVERAWIEAGEGKAIIRVSKRAEVDGLWQDIKDGIIRNISVGYKVYEYTLVEERDGVPVYRATDWEPYELSFVPIPADMKSQVRAAGREQPEGKPQQPENRQMEKDDNKSTPNTEQQQPAATPAPVVAPVVSEQERSKIESETLSRVNEVLELCRKHGMSDEFRTKLIAGKVDVDAARRLVLDELARSAPQTSNRVQVTTERDERDVMRDGIKEAILHRVDPVKNKLTDNGKQYRALTLLELGKECLHAAGVNTRGMSKMEIAGRALHGTGDFPIITADVANKTLRDAYESTGRSFTVWARQTSAPDFKEIKRVQLGEAPSLLEVKEHGEFKRGTVGEGQEKYQLITYGRIIGVTRQLLINDDLSAFTRIPALFGAAAADLESDLVYDKLTSNPVMADGFALFSAQHGNLGAAAAIDIDGLSAARESMRFQKGLAGRFINVRPAYLIVGPKNETAAAQYLSNSFVPNTSGTINPFSSANLTLVVDPRIEDDKWYMAAAPSQIDTIEYCYLEGESGVAIDTRMGFDVDGMEIKVRHDFGVGLIDFRGLFQNPYAGA